MLLMTRYVEFLHVIIEFMHSVVNISLGHCGKDSRKEDLPEELPDVDRGIG